MGMSSMIENMAKRRSVRTYRAGPVGNDLKQTLLEYVLKNSTGPFGNTIRFSLVEISESEKKDIKSLGTYGMIRGANLYLSGAVKPAPYAMEDFGYCMEKAVLKATELGLGTCWLGGTLNRGNFGSRTGLQKGEVIPAATPIGFAGDNPRLWEHTVRMMVKAHTRKPFASLFFSESETVPMVENAGDPFIKILENVRSAPSASNKQPWRIIRKGNEFSFYLDEDKLYNSAFPNIKIQNLDIGIAISHFDLSAEELGFQGVWLPEAPVLKTASWVPIATWKMK